MYVQICQVYLNTMSSLSKYNVRADMSRLSKYNVRADVKFTEIRADTPRLPKYAQKDVKFTEICTDMPSLPKYVERCQGY